MSFGALFFLAPSLGGLGAFKQNFGPNITDVVKRQRMLDP